MANRELGLDVISALCSDSSVRSQAYYATSVRSTPHQQTTSGQPLVCVATPKISHNRGRRLQVHAIASVTRPRAVAFPCPTLTAKPLAVAEGSLSPPNGFNHPHIVLTSLHQPTLSAHCPSRLARHHWACDEQGTDCRLHVRRPAIKASVFATPSLLFY